MGPFLLLLVLLAAHQHLSIAQTPSPTHTCSIILLGNGSNSIPSKFSLHCWPRNNSSDAAVKVQFGWSLLKLLRRNVISPDLSGVSIEWNVTARPYCSTARLECDNKTLKANPIADDAPYNDRTFGAEDWGLDILNVPHLALVDTLVKGIPQSSMAPLLQFLNCSYLTATNVTLEGLEGPSGLSRTTFGAARVTGLEFAALQGIQCSDVRGGTGWACILLQAKANATITIRDSSFFNNSVRTDGNLLSSPDEELGANAQQAGLAPPSLMSQEDVHSSDTSEMLPLHLLSCNEDGSVNGYGAVLIAYSWDTNPCSEAHQVADMDATVLVERTIMNNNRGGCGAAITVRSPAVDGALTDCQTDCQYRRDVHLTFKDSTIIGNYASKDGGGIYYSDTWGGTVHMNLTHGSNLSNNWANELGGGAALRSSYVGDVTIADANVSFNIALGGGGLFVEARDSISALIVSGSTFAYNKGWGFGGAMSATCLSIGEIHIAGGSVLVNNSAYEGGGALYLSVDVSLASLAVGGASMLSGNWAKNNGGGAIYVAGGGEKYCALKSVQLSNGSKLIGNQAEGGNGGAIYLIALRIEQPLLITGGASILYNTAVDGGAIFVGNHTRHAGLILTDRASVSFNSAKGRGGAIFLDGGSSQDVVNYVLQLDAGAIASNNTASNGGFLYMNGNATGNMTVQLKITSSCVTNNSAQSHGGAIFVMNVGFLNATVEGESIIALNRAVLGEGGAFNLQGNGGNLTITGASNVSSNQAWTNGGGIYMSIVDGIEGIRVDGSSLLSGNTAETGDGGALFAMADVIRQMLVTDHSGFIQNKASGSGGAIMLKSSGDKDIAELVVTWDGMSYLTNNSAARKGAGVYAYAPVVNASVLGKSQVSGNTAQDDGGALYVDNSEESKTSYVMVDGASQLNSNRAKNGGAMYVRGFAKVWVGGNSTMVQNTAVYDGGAAFLAQLPPEIQLQSCSISDNKANRGSGGAFCVTTVEPVFPKDSSDPSCLLLPGNTMTISIIDAAFERNEAGVADGGVLYFKPHETCIDFRGNVSLLINMSNFINNAALGAGGAIALRDASDTRFMVNIVNSNFRGNTAGTITGDFTSSANFGGALALWREPIDSSRNSTEDCLLTVDDTSFEGNSCDGGTGGAVMLISCSSRFSRCNFTANHATQSGGAIGAIQVARSTATLGLATSSSYTATNGQSLWGQQRRLLSVVTRATNSPRGVRRELGDATEQCSISSAEWSASLTECRFSRNSADREYGGALYLYSSSDQGQIHISRCAFEMNRAIQQPAGAVFLAGRGANTSLQVYNSSFLANAAEMSSAGALYILIGQDACAALENVTMVNNQASKSAGAAVLDVRSKGSLHVRSVSGEQNDAATGDGGAIQLQLQMDALAFLSTCNFTNNRAAGNGGALVADVNCSSSLLVEKSVITNNRAGSSGGGIYISYGSRPAHTVDGSLFGSASTSAPASPCPNMSDSGQRSLVQSVRFMDNTAGQQGGAIFLAPSSTLTILDSSMINNTACEGGGSMAAQNCSSLIIRHSIMQNSSTSASGGGFFTYGCRRLLLEYLNITGNVAGFSGGGLTVSGPPDGLLAGDKDFGSDGTTGDAPEYTSLIIHKALVSDNAAALSGNAAGWCQSSGTSQPWGKGVGGGILVTGKVVGVLSNSNLEQPNNAFLGNSIASTQRCKSANASISVSKSTIIDPDWMSKWDQSWGLLDTLAATECWLLQLSDTLLPSATETDDTSASPQTLHSILMEDFLASALQVQCRSDVRVETLVYNMIESPEEHDSACISVRDRLSSSITRRANFTKFVAGQVLMMATADGAIPQAATVASGLSRTWFEWLINQLAECMRNPSSLSKSQLLHAMQLQSYMALPAAYVGLRLSDEMLLHSQLLQLQPGYEFNLTAQLYDMSSKAVSWDMAPSTITLALRPQRAPNVMYNESEADGSTPWLDVNAANMDPGLNKSLTVPVVNGSATWSNVKAYAWPGFYSLLISTNYSSSVKVAPLEMDVEVLPCGVGQTLDRSHSSYRTPWTACATCPSEQYSLWRDARPLLTKIALSTWDADDVRGAANLTLYHKSMNDTLNAQDSACVQCPAHALCLRGAVIVPNAGYWHSAANSTRIHACPNPSACKVDGHKRTFPVWLLGMVGLHDYRTGLLSWCQLAWYSSVVPGAAARDAYSLQSALLADGSTQPLTEPDGTIVLTSSTASEQTATDSDFPRCLVSGLPSGHPDSYMQQQCAEGYTGNLCAACIQGHYVDSDFNCKRCPGVAHTAGLGLISFFGSVLLVLFTTVTNFAEGFGEEMEGQQAQKQSGKASGRVEIGDVVKVIVLHLQYLIIVTRLNVNYPSVILRCQAAFSAITGAENYLVYSPSCLQPDSDSAGQALIQWLAGILTPCAITVVSMLLWALRYAYHFRRAGLRGFSNGARSLRVALVNLPKSLTAWRDTRSSRSETHSVCDSEDTSTLSRRTEPTIANILPRTSFVNQEASIGLSTVFRNVQVVALEAADASTEDPTVARAASPEAATSGSFTEALQQGMPASANAALVVDLNGVEVGSSTEVPKPASHITPTGNGNNGGWQRPAGACGAAIVPVTLFDHLSDMPGILRAGDPISSSGPPLLHGNSICVLADGTRIEPASVAAVLAGANSSGYAIPYYYRHPYEMLHRRTSKTLASMGSAALNDAMKTIHKLRTLAVSTQQSSHAAIVQVDRAMSLREQLGVVLMAAVFILYPSWANAALSTFACYYIDDGKGPFSATQQATWRYGYWVRNMQAACYSGDHLRVYVPIGLVAVVIFCLLPPLASFLFVWRVRGRLEDTHVRKVYGFLYKRYKPRFIWWETMLQLETLILVSVEVLGRGLNVSYQALLLLAVFTVIALVNVSCAPLLSRLLVIMEFISLGTLSLTITLSLSFTVDETLNPVAESALAILIIVINTCLMVFFLYFASRHFWPSAVKKVAPTAHALLRKLSSIGINAGDQRGTVKEVSRSGGNQPQARWPVLSRLITHRRSRRAASLEAGQALSEEDELGWSLDRLHDEFSDRALTSGAYSTSLITAQAGQGMDIARASICLEDRLCSAAMESVDRVAPLMSHVCIRLDEGPAGGADSHT